MLTALDIKFSTGITINTISRSKEGIKGLSNQAFDRSIKLGHDLATVKLWWKEEGKELFKQEGFTTAWDEAVKALTGFSRSQYNKLVKAAADAEEMPEVFEAYKAAEEEAGQSRNIERWAEYVKDSANAEAGEEVEVSEVREGKGKKLGQFRLSGCCTDIYVNSSFEIETKAEDADAQVMLGVMKTLLSDAGFKGAAAMIKVPTKVDETTGLSIKDEVVQYLSGEIQD